MENAIKRNKDNARRIETWLLNRISLMGGKKVAMAVGVNESQVTRWKSSWV
ncbi:CII family transcriptional regulator, partial [Klebsiella pneumoniae]